MLNKIIQFGEFSFHIVKSNKGKIEEGCESCNLVTMALIVVIDPLWTLCCKVIDFALLQ